MNNLRVCLLFHWPKLPTFTFLCCSRWIKMDSFHHSSTMHIDTLISISFWRLAFYFYSINKLHLDAACAFLLRPLICSWLIPKILLSFAICISLVLCFLFLGNVQLVPPKSISQGTLKHRKAYSISICGGYLRDLFVFPVSEVLKNNALHMLKPQDCKSERDSFCHLCKIGVNKWIVFLSVIFKPSTSQWSSFPKSTDKRNNIKVKF